MSSRRYQVSACTTVSPPRTCPKSNNIDIIVGEKRDRSVIKASPSPQINLNIEGPPIRTASSSNIIQNSHSLPLSTRLFPGNSDGDHLTPKTTPGGSANTH